MNVNKRGQVLVLFALILTVLIGFSALVIDIGSKFAFERRYQSVADAASHKPQIATSLTSGTAERKWSTAARKSWPTFSKVLGSPVLSPMPL